MRLIRFVPFVAIFQDAPLLRVFWAYGRDRDRTDDLYRVKVALIPTELRAREVHPIVSGGGKACQSTCG